MTNWQPAPGATPDFRAGTGFGLGLFALLLLTYLVYRPGLTGPLVLDDFWNLIPLGDGGGITDLNAFLQFVFGNTSGPSGRPLAMLSFLLDARDWPPPVPALKYTNIMIHLLCGLAICWMSLLLALALAVPRPQAMAIALGVCGVWLLQPLQVSTTLYVVQRMVQLMTLFATLALVFYLKGRSMLESRPHRALLYLVLALCPFGVLSVLSKENGVLLLLLVVILEHTLFGERPGTRPFRLWYRTGILFPLVVVCAYLLYLLPSSIPEFEYRYFSLGERLLTETRLLVVYLWKILLPNVIGNGLYHDDLVLSTSLVNPISTLFATGLLLALLGSAGYFRKTQPVYSVAVLWFFGMHSLESTWLPLELYFEHRNYLAMVGPLFALVWYFRLLLINIERKFLARLVKVSAALYLGLCLLLTVQLTTLWSDAATLHGYWAREQPLSMRAQMTYAEDLAYVGNPRLALEHAELARRYHPDEVTVQLFIWNLACEGGLPSPVSLERIAGNPALEYYRDDINYHLEKLIGNLTGGKCDYPDEDTMIALFNRLGEFAMPDFRKSGYHVFFSDLYLYYGRLDPALINLTRAFELSPVPQLPIRQAILSASAGRFADALVFLERARRADRSRRFFLPSHESEIARLQSDFERRLNAVH